jgi:hypothetical protein
MRKHRAVNGPECYPVFRRFLRAKRPGLAESHERTDVLLQLLEDLALLLTEGDCSLGVAHQDLLLTMREKLDLGKARIDDTHVDSLGD